MTEKPKNNRLIKKLEKRYEATKATREEKEERERPLKERFLDIFSAPRSANTDFFCTKCKKDCSGTGYRQVCTIRTNAPTAWFIGICPKGHKMIRRITDKNTDPYYELSPIIQRQRYELADALIDPSDPRFKVLYPKQFAEIMGKK